jgi:hypothetical protein
MLSAKVRDPLFLPASQPGLLWKGRKANMTQTRLLAAITSSLCLIACGSSTSDGPKTSASGDNCPSLAGAYSLTTEIVSTTCSVGLHAITEPASYTFTQAAPSCNFTMTNSIYAGSTYTGHFAMEGSQAKVIWDSVAPAPSVAGYALTYTGEDLTITPAAAPATSTIVGSFTWQSAAACDGTTNVCNGSVPAGCLTPQ